MRDPYVVLGVSRNASDDEIKKAYRKLSRMYHPDANVNNPNKEQAEEKFKEIQAAYQQIMNPSKSTGGAGNAGGSYTGNGFGGYGSGFGGFGGGFGGYGSGFGGFGNGFGGSGGYSGQNGQNHYGDTSGEDEDTIYVNAAYRYASNGMYREAMNVLNQVKNKSARFYYVSSVTNAGLGNQAVALEHIRVALNMEPDNMEYQQFLHYLQSGGDWYTSRGMGYGSPVAGGSNLCFKLCMANIFLNLCCGGTGVCCGGNGMGGYM